jgi:hypothetical protein
MLVVLPWLQSGLLIQGSFLIQGNRRTIPHIDAIGHLSLSGKCSIDNGMVVIFQVGSEPWPHVDFIERPWTIEPSVAEYDD